MKAIFLPLILRIIQLFLFRNLLMDIGVVKLIQIRILADLIVKGDYY
jgi:hypothetical protein